MKCLSTFLAVAAVCLGLLQAQEAPPAKLYQAEVLRSTSGKIVNDAGFASGNYPLRKGQVLDVLTGNMSEAILSSGGQRIKVSRSELRIYERPAVTAAAPPPPGFPGAPPAPPAPPPVPFTPGELVVISAKYTMVGNQPRNVKNKVEKLIPTGTLTAPVQLLVSDDLSRATANQGQVAAVVRTGNNSATIIERPKNILTIQFTYNGQAFTKQGIEGTYLTLP